jgi:hypothetical protein
MVQPKHIYSTGIITGALCGVLAALTAYKVMNYIAATVAAKGESSVGLLVVIMGLGGALVGTLVAIVVHKMNK